MKSKKLIVVFLLLIIISLLFVFYFINRKNNVNLDGDAYKFKEEYEEVNGDEGYGGSIIRTIDIPGNNPFIYSEASDIVDMINNKETFVVYFGFATCPWCRSVLEEAIKVFEDLDIDKVYYVDVKEIRDTLVVNDDGIVVTKKEGSDSYYKLLELMDDVLENYTLYDKEGNEVNSNEKRIYAPNFVSIVDGKPTKLETGISDNQEDAYMELTDEIKKDMYNKLKCSIECVKENKKMCTNKC